MAKLQGRRWFSRALCMLKTKKVCETTTGVLLNSVKSITSFGWGKDGNVTSARWQVTLCDPTWRVPIAVWQLSELLYPCYFLHTSLFLAVYLCSTKANANYIGKLFQQQPPAVSRFYLSKKKVSTDIVALRIAWNVNCLAMSSRSAGLPLHHNSIQWFTAKSKSLSTQTTASARP